MQMHITKRRDLCRQAMNVPYWLTHRPEPVQRPVPKILTLEGARVEGLAEALSIVCRGNGGLGVPCHAVSGWVPCIEKSCVKSKLADITLFETDMSDRSRCIIEMYDTVCDKGLGGLIIVEGDQRSRLFQFCSYLREEYNDSDEQVERYIDNVERVLIPSGKYSPIGTIHLRDSIEGHDGVEGLKHDGLTLNPDDGKLSPFQLHIAHRFVLSLLSRGSVESI
jgi:hypothetical protein